MIAVCAGLLLSIAAAHVAAPSAGAVGEDNSARARRGLLPRKAVRAAPPARSRRVVLVPPAPTYLGAPGAVPIVAQASGVEVDVSLVLRWRVPR